MAARRSFLAGVVPPAVGLELPHATETIARTANPATSSRSCLDMAPPRDDLQEKLSTRAAASQWAPAYRRGFPGKKRTATITPARPPTPMASRAAPPPPPPPCEEDADFIACEEGETGKNL